MTRSTVVLVRPDGEVLGTSEKLDAHRAPGALHLAFSVFVYNDRGEVLLQRRALSKYHFPGYWANTCCSHPGPGEELVASATDRLAEELGMCCELVEVGSFVYRAACPRSGRVEHELDHVLIGRSDQLPRPDASEVAATAWVHPAAILAGRPEGDRAPWLVPGLEIAERGREVMAW